MTAKELYERQKWTLAQKIDHSLGTIDQFIAKTDGKVYLAFSGGKDSTVLMHLCEIIKKDLLCVFVNTGCEYLDIIRFVNECQKDGHNIKIIRPEYKPREVWEKYGFPLVSTEFIEHALELLPDGGLYIALMNITYLHGIDRYKRVYSKGTLREVYVHSKKINVYKNNIPTGNTSMCVYAWYVFQKGYIGQPTLYWL